MRNVTYINAGAGSGKTYTLTKILAEKLSKKEVKKESKNENSKNRNATARPPG